MSDKALSVRDDMSLAEIGTAFVKSGYFQDVTDASKAIVKILAGREFGFGAFASMTNIHIIQGRPSVGASLMASAVKGSARYDYRIRQMDEKACSIEFFERVDGKPESLGTSTFTLDDARKAGTKNLDKYPRNMLFARAISNGVKWYCPDVFGAAVYVPEELGTAVNEEGDIIPGSFTTPTVTVYPPETEPIVPIDPSPNGAGHEVEAVPAKMSLESAEAEVNSKGVRYGDLDTETLSHMANALETKLRSQALPSAERETKQFKLDACKVIMAARSTAEQKAAE